MGKQYNKITSRIQKFIEQQHLFFVATATKDSRVNLSPKGMDSFRVLDENRVIWLNLTGSGNETSAHLQQDGRITVMFCAFEGAPMILRLYGTGKVIHPRDQNWAEMVKHFPKLAGARQIFDLEIDLVQTSCGMAVPYLDFKSERLQLNDWAEEKGEQGIKDYWTDKNQTTIDGIPTNINEK